MGRHAAARHAGVQVLRRTGPQVSAYPGRPVDAIAQFDVLGGDALFDDPNIASMPTRAARTARSGCAATTGSSPTRGAPGVRASVDRPALIEQLSTGKADLGNDHLDRADLPVLRRLRVPQRERDIDKAKALLTDAGHADLTATLHAGELQEIPELAELLQEPGQEAGFNLEYRCREPDRSTARSGARPSRRTRRAPVRPSLGIVDYGHRATPDVYLNARSRRNGIWNSSQYMSPGLRRGLRRVPGSRRRRRPEGRVQEDRDDPQRRTCPSALPYFYNFLAGNSKNFTGVSSSALGQMFLRRRRQGRLTRRSSEGRSAEPSPSRSHLNQMKA